MIRADKKEFGRIIGLKYARYNLSQYFMRFSVDDTAFDSSHNLPTLLYFNHSSWWDAQTSLYLVEQVLQLDFYMMGLEQSIIDRPFMRKYGCFGVDNSSPFAVSKALKYAADLLSGQAKRGLVVFPQGNYVRGHKRPLQLQSGVSHIARLVKHIAILPVTLHYEFFLEKRPEIFAKIGSPLIFRGDVPTTRVLTSQLTEILTSQLDTLQVEVDNFQVENYRTVLQGYRNPLVHLWHRIRK